MRENVPLYGATVSGGVMRHNFFLRGAVPVHESAVLIVDVSELIAYHVWTKSAHTVDGNLLTEWCSGDHCGRPGHVTTTPSSTAMHSQFSAFHTYLRGLSFGYPIILQHASLVHLITRNAFIQASFLHRSRNADFIWKYNIKFLRTELNWTEELISMGTATTTYST